MLLFAISTIREHFFQFSLIEYVFGVVPLFTGEMSDRRESFLFRGITYMITNSMVVQETLIPYLIKYLDIKN